MIGSYIKPLIKIKCIHKQRHLNLTELLNIAEIKISIR